MTACQHAPGVFLPLLEQLPARQFPRPPRPLSVSSLVILVERKLVVLLPVLARKSNTSRQQGMSHERKSWSIRHRVLSAREMLGGTVEWR